jgi:hypothetical protein
MPAVSLKSSQGVQNMKTTPDALGIAGNDSLTAKPENGTRHTRFRRKRVRRAKHENVTRRAPYRQKHENGTRRPRDR